LEGSERYGARSWPNCFSVAGFVLPTMMGTSFGNTDSEGKDLLLISFCNCCRRKREIPGKNLVDVR
jgi:hypothetical protein